MQAAWIGACSGSTATGGRGQRLNHISYWSINDQLFNFGFNVCQQTLVDDPVPAYPYITEQLGQIMGSLAQYLVRFNFAPIWRDPSINNVHRHGEALISQLLESSHLTSGVHGQVRLPDITPPRTLQTLNPNQERLIWKLTPQLLSELLLVN